MSSDKCPVCGQRIIPLFLTRSCEWCEKGPGDSDILYEGYVTLNDGEAEYALPVVGLIFKFSEGAKLFSEVYGNETDTLWEVVSTSPIYYGYNGKLLGDLATTLVSFDYYKVYPDHKFIPGEHDVWLRRRLF